MSLFSSQYAQNLEPMPLLPLEERCKAFLSWAEPLLSSEEYGITEEAAQNLWASGSPGNQLYQELQSSLREDLSLETLRPFWERWYLRHDMALPVNLNPYYVLDVEAPRGSALAAHLVVRALELHQQLSRGDYPQEALKGVPQSMSQYDKIFGCSRLPGKKGDTTLSADRASHIIIFRRGRIYSLKVLDEQGRIPRKEELEALFENMYNTAQPLAFSPGVFTAADRPEWAECRSILREHPQNKANMDLVEQALFVLVLEDDVEGESGLCRNLMAGMPDNRWYDKSLQFIVYPQGAGGWNYEHSCRDGGMMSHVAAFLCKDPSGEEPCMERLAPPESLEFELTPELEERARKIRRQDARMRQRIRQDVVFLPSFGASRIKKARISPDAFVQLVLLGIQKELWGELRCCFESVSLRHFRNGRTEGTRPLTSEARKCVEAWAQGAGAETLAPLLRRAGRAHQERIRECRDARGIDGHLGFLESFALYRERNPEDMPFFASPGWKKFNDFWMSTSATGGKGIRVAGYGPAVPEGFAVRYVKNPGELGLFLATLDGDLQVFQEIFCRVGEDFLKALSSCDAE